MTDDTYEVFAVRYAEHPRRTRSASFIADDDHAAPHPLDFFIWVARNRERTILIDTGFDGAEGATRDRPIIMEPAAALAAIGIAPDTIERVVVTHLHFDHAGGLAQFPGVPIHMQEAEMAFATGPCMCHETLRSPYTVGHVCEAVKRLYSGLVEFHAGDAEVAPGIRVHLIGGHSSGLQCVTVKTDDGPVVLASDASHFYENVEERKLFTILMDAAEMLHGFDRLRQLAGSEGIIVPGHDPLVRQRFPQAFPEAGVDVRRLSVH